MVEIDNHMLIHAAGAALNEQFRREVLNVMTGVPRGFNGQDAIPPLRNMCGGSSDGEWPKTNQEGVHPTNTIQSYCGVWR